MALILGFDPGGRGQFGWCTAEYASSQLRIQSAGVADHALGAVTAALEQLEPGYHITAAGIDAPLLWATGGPRRADRTIRMAMKSLGAVNVGGTVQDTNSLRGACVAQGLLTAKLLRDRFPDLPITESHPKALLWLLQLAGPGRSVPEVTLTHLEELVLCELVIESEHIRDAALGAVAALAMLEERQGWRDLYLEEVNSWAPVSPVSYWMPIGEPRYQYAF